MNCQQLQEVLFEYLEESLPQEQRAEADAHLALCAQCMASVQRQKEMQERLSSRLEQCVGGLSLGSSGRAQLFRVLESHDRARQFISVQIWAKLWGRVAAAAGACALVALFSLSIWRRQTTISSNKTVVPPPVAQQSFDSRPTIQIRLPGVAASYTFQQNGEFVVDTFIEPTNFVNVTLWSSDNEPAESKSKERKMPL